MLEPCAMKVASTVLRRECHREMGFLSDLLFSFTPIDNTIVSINIAFK